jgi:hypothetical protein
MPQLGQKRTFCDAEAMSAFPPIADIRRFGSDVRFVPKADMEPRLIASLPEAFSA